MLGDREILCFFQSRAEMIKQRADSGTLKNPHFIYFCYEFYFYPTTSEARREVANLTERKNRHTSIKGTGVHRINVEVNVKDFVVNVKV